MQNLDFPIYLVSLKQDERRRKKLEAFFPKYFSFFCQIEAVDGRLLSAGEYFKKIQTFYGKYNRLMSPAELGCTLSHIKVLECFLDSGEEKALVLEDDVIGSDEDLEKVQKLASRLPEVSLFICGGQDGLSNKYLLGVFLDKFQVNEVSKFSYSHIFRTSCYVVTRKSATEILNYHYKKMYTLADKWDVFFENSDIKIFYENILRHPEDLLDSHIEADRAIYKKSFIRKILDKNVFIKIITRLSRELTAMCLILSGHRRL